MTEQELLQQIAAGDTRAFTALYYLFQPKVYSTAFHYLQQAENAEEITQDVFLEIHRSAAKFNGRSSVNTWIYRITVNKCLDKIRYLKAKKRLSFLSVLGIEGTEASEIQFADKSHHGHEADKRENYLILLQCINKLPEQQKTALILTQLEEISIKETAIIMNSTAKAVESLTQRAKKNLRKELEKIYEEIRRK